MSKRPLVSLIRNKPVDGCRRYFGDEALGRFKFVNLCLGIICLDGFDPDQVWKRFVWRCGAFGGWQVTLKSSFASEIAIPWDQIEPIETDPSF